VLKNSCQLAASLITTSDCWSGHYTTIFYQHPDFHLLQEYEAKLIFSLKSIISQTVLPIKYPCHRDNHSQGLIIHYQEISCAAVLRILTQAFFCIKQIRLRKRGNATK
jgi:hypothetical protein